MLAPFFFVRLTALCECVWDDHVILVVVLVLLVKVVCVYSVLYSELYNMWSGRPHFLLFSNFGPPARRGAKTFLLWSEDLFVRRATLNSQRLSLSCLSSMSQDHAQG